MKNENKQLKVRVTAVKGLSPNVRAIRFKFVEKDDAKDFSYLPGQFIMVSVPGYGESPLTITTPPSLLPEFEIAVRSAGNNTFAINRLNIGDTAYIRGPLGNGIDFSKIYGKELVIIAGGIGIAPLMAIIRQVKEDKTIVGKLRVIYGVKDADNLLFKEELATIEKYADSYITVDKADKNWQGLTGFIPDVVKKLEFSKSAVAIVCGPPVIYKKISGVLRQKGLAEDNILLMLERRMKCGIGKCQHCTCGKKYVCIDGPVFPYSEIKDNWEALK